MHWLNRMIVAVIGVLLPAGVLAATTVDPDGPGATGGRVGATGFAAEVVVEHQPAGSEIAPAVVTTVVPPPPTSVVPPGPTTSAAAPPTTTTGTPLPAATPGSTHSTLLPGLPLPGRPSLPSLEPPVSSWSSTAGNVSARMRMDPATPVPGQPVRFYLDVVAPEACCAMNLSYGDGVVSPNAPGGCNSPTTRTATLTHTFAAPGNYELRLVATTFPCKTTTVDGQFVPPALHGTSIKACITAGLPLLGQPACTPDNHFGPHTVASGA